MYQTVYSASAPSWSDADHRGGWTQIFGGDVSEPETSRPVKNAVFNYTLHLAHPLGVIPSVFCTDLLHHKTRVPGLSYGVVFEILRLAVLTEHRLVTDRRTDGRTHDDSKYRASIASRG